jgi:predicted hexulose-6-phosphate isomerase
MGSSFPSLAGELPGKVLVGLYEKALPAEWSWEERLAATAGAGYRYLEISMDETDGRLARLKDVAEQREIRRAIENSGVPIMTMCLSAHRRFPLGSADPAIRERGYEIMRRAIDFSVYTGVRIVQVAGYDAYYEPHTTETISRYIEGLHLATNWASQAGVMLALENVDAPISASLHDGMKLVAEMDSPWFQMYPDMANVAAEGFDPCRELALCAGHVVAVHVKDGQPKVVRGVPYGTGIVPFDEVFRTLRGIDFYGPMTVEMWAQFAADPLDAARQARIFVKDLLDRHYR